MILDSAENPIENQQNFSPGSERQSSDWDVRNAPKNYLWLVLTQGGSVIFAFAAVWLLTRVFGSQGYGGIVAVIAASQIAQVCVNWTSFSLVRFGVDEFVETQKIARVFWVRFSILAVNIVLAFLIAKLWYPDVAASFNFLPETYWLVFAHFVSLALWNHVQLSLQGAKMARVQGFLLMLERVAILASLLFCWYIDKLYISTAILCYIASSFGATLIGLYILRGYIWSRFTVDFDFYKKIIVFSLPLLPVTLFGYFSGQSIDAVFISHFLSTSDLGVYSVAVQMNGILLQVPTLANSLLIPLFVTLEKENQTHKIQRFFQDVLPSMSLVWCMLCSLAGFVGYYTLPYIFGAQFAGAVTPLWILVAAAAVAFPVLAGYSALSQAISATYISMFGAIFAASANLALNFLLIPRFGMLGCAWATVIAYSVSVACFGFFLRRTGKISLSWIVYSILPALVGAVTFTATETAYWSLLACMAAAVVVTYTQRESIKLAFYFMKGSMGK